ncbi:unnamed protein product [Rotaria sp. Silwood2]|nr:unnamed protein product [Rotaria sp. Silwood2]CAF4428523.1 unnamed protein product [Rotaria sp. Silwood2]
MIQNRSYGLSSFFIKRICFLNCLVFQLISQICIEPSTNERELLIQSLCSFALGLCLLPSNNNLIQPYSTESFKQLINKRIGINLFQEKLRIISKSEFYIKALEKPQLKFLVSNEMIFDHEFAHLYETLQSSISNILTKQEIISTDNSFIVPT